MHGKKRLCGPTPSQLLNVMHLDTPYSVVQGLPGDFHQMGVVGEEEDLYISGEFGQDLKGRGYRGLSRGTLVASQAA